jgi:hypothetical protein
VSAARRAARDHATLALHWVREARRAVREGQWDEAEKCLSLSRDHRASASGWRARAARHGVAAALSMFARGLARSVHLAVVLGRWVTSTGR